VRDRLVEATRCEAARQLPQGVQPDHHARLAQERADVMRPPPHVPGGHERHPGYAAPQGKERRLLPGKHQVRHISDNTLMAV